MKDKRIWIVIICIFVIGSGLTKYTHSYVSSRSSGAAQADAAVIQESAAFDGPEASLQAGARLGSPEGEISAAEESAASFSGETGPSPSDSPSAFEEGAPDAEAASAAEETAAAARAALVEGEGMADAGAAAAGESAAADQVPISPLIGARPAETTGGSSVDYIQRLKDLDAQIARIQNEEQEANVYSIMTSAESELKMWESELRRHLFSSPRNTFPGGCPAAGPGAAGVEPEPGGPGPQSSPASPPWTGLDMRQPL